MPAAIATLTHPASALPPRIARWLDIGNALHTTSLSALWIGAFITRFVAAGDAGSKPGVSLRQVGQFVADAVM
jgi:hypothetical protein